MIVNTQRFRFLTWMCAVPAILACVLWPVHAYIQTPLAFSSDSSPELRWALDAAPSLAPVIKRQGQSGLELAGLPKIEVSILDIQERGGSVSHDSPDILHPHILTASPERAPPSRLFSC